MEQPNTIWREGVNCGSNFQESGRGLGINGPLEIENPIDCAFKIYPLRFCQFLTPHGHSAHGCSKKTTEKEKKRGTHTHMDASIILASAVCLCLSWFSVSVWLGVIRERHGVVFACKHKSQYHQVHLVYFIRSNTAHSTASTLTHISHLLTPFINILTHTQKNCYILSCVCRFVYCIFVYLLHINTLWIVCGLTSVIVIYSE